MSYNVGKRKDKGYFIKFMKKVILFKKNYEKGYFIKKLKVILL